LEKCSIYLENAGEFRLPGDGAGVSGDGNRWLCPEVKIRNLEVTGDKELDVFSMLLDV
jgi:hypothetical protein